LADYWPRAAYVTGASLLTSVLRRHEERKYGPKLSGVKVQAPLFILGHARSGTTHLHNLLAADPRFAYPNTFQMLNPHTFLSTERYLKVLERVLPKTRGFDNLSLSFEAPQEHEPATCIATSRSPFMGYAFPRSGDHYERYLTFRGVPEVETDRWKAGLSRFLKKLAWKYEGRPLILKTPPDTCRIGLLLKMFPDARFVHVHRNPYAVFRSAKKMREFMFRSTGLQRRNPEDDEDSRIIERYREMYDVFFEERGLIPEGRFHEVCFEELARDPVGQVEGIYEGLNIPGFETFRPSLETYVSSISSYRKNEHSEIPPSLRRRIARAWKRSFDEWGYDYDLEEWEYDHDQAV
jgi:LPS sulfotransferase NodH